MKLNQQLTGRRPLGNLALCLALLFVSAFGFSTDATAEQPGLVTKEFVYLKAPFPQCHASTVAETDGQVIVAAWFGGTREKHKDVGVWFARRDGDQWTTPVEVANGIQYRKLDGTVHRHPCWNPVLHQSPDGPLMLFYKCGPSPSTWWGMLTISSDGGQTWTVPRRLPEGIDGPVKNKPLLLDDGTLLCGSSTEFDGWRVHFELTKGNAKVWRRSEPINDGKEIGAIQPSILNHGDGVLQALGRSRQKRIWQAWSKDYGKTWGEMTLTDLPNPNAGTDAVTLDNGSHVLVYNHTERGRSPLSVATSSDGKQWQAAIVLEDEPGEYSYPAVIQSSDGMVHITYTWRRERVRHVVLDPKKLDSKPIVNGKWPD